MWDLSALEACRTGSAWSLPGLHLCSRCVYLSDARRSQALRKQVKHVKHVMTMLGHQMGFCTSATLLRCLFLISRRHHCPATQSWLRVWL